VFQVLTSGKHRFLKPSPSNATSLGAFSPNAIVLHNVKQSNRKAILRYDLPLVQEMFISQSRYTYAYAVAAEWNCVLLASQNNVSWTHPILSFKTHTRQVVNEYHFRQAPISNASFWSRLKTASWRSSSLYLLFFSR